MSLQNLDINSNWAKITIALCKSYGVKHFINSPGMRSAPISLALGQDSEVQVTNIIDERSAAYFALGVVKETKSPAALVCTSGTALANYLPAIIESYQTKYPIIVISADRPEELHGVDANQTINQSNIFGEYICHKLLLPTASDNISEDFLISKLEKCLDELVLQNRPVHINIPFRGDLTKISDRNYHFDIKATSHKREFQGSDITHDLVRPLLVIGDLSFLNEEDRNSLADILKNIKVPFVADLTSGIKHLVSENQYMIKVLDHRESLEQLFNSYKPDGIIHIGERIISNDFFRVLSNHDISIKHLNFRQSVYDPSNKVRERFEISLEEAIEYLKNIKEIHYIHKYKFNSNTMDLTQAHIIQTLSDFCNENDKIVLGNSSIIRAFDQFPDYPISSDLHFNRGVSGIEGILSMACGIASVNKNITWVILGDLSFMHDIGSLWTSVHSQNIKIIICNNQRGGIFSSLPIPKNSKGFKNIETPHEFSFYNSIKLDHVQMFQIVDTSQTMNIFSDMVSHQGPSLCEVMINHEKDIEKC